MLQYMFFGRLTREKGIYTILDAIKLLDQEQKSGTNKILSQLHFFICGDGPARQDVMKATTHYPQLHYFGQIDAQALVRKLSNVHYTLMPSQVPESFGMSALESLNMGVPVIGHQTGGLRQFVPGYLSLDNQTGETHSQQLRNLLKWTYNTFSTTTRESYSDHARNTAQKYTSNTRLENFRTLMVTDIPKKYIQRTYKLPSHLKTQDRHPFQKILLISDYRNNIGGIETSIQQIHKLLRQAGYEVSVWGYTFPGGTIGRLLRKLCAICAPINIFAYRHIHKIYKKINPDLVRRHSVHRCIGPLGLRPSKQWNVPQWIMHHDAGVVAPFASRVKSEQDLPQDNSKASFFASHNTYTFLQKIGAHLKRRNLQRIKQQLQQSVCLHLVPSDFLLNPIKQFYETSKVKTLPHSVDEFFAGVNQGLQQKNQQTDTCQQSCGED